MNRRLNLVVCAIVVILSSVASPVHASSSAWLHAGRPCGPDQIDLWGVDCRPSSNRPVPVLPTPVPQPLPQMQTVLPYTYAYVMAGPIGLYANPADPENGIPPKRVLEAGYVWVRLVGQVVHNNQVWYLTEGGGYLSALQAAIYKPSAFQGVVPSGNPAVPFAWVLHAVKTSLKPGAKPEANAAQYGRYEIVNIYDHLEADGQVWYRIGNDQWVVQTAVAKVAWRQRPPEVGPGDKWIDVSLFEQALAAYEGDRMVYATLVSSGLPQWATVQGLFRIQSKYTLSPMVGREGKPDFYALESVPWSMYFFRDYALHGAYWHDDFGWQHSHGCVNLAPLDAKWLFEWTTPVVPPGGQFAAARPDQGTWVWVHD